jgi:predicted porin
VLILKPFSHQGENMRKNLKLSVAHRAIRCAIPAIYCAFAMGAYAQSAPSGQVVIYGVVDAAATASNNGVTSLKQSSTSVSSPSRWGIRVREDLGDGLFATVNLEQGFSIDTGSLTLNRSFGRGATVGIGHANYGQVTFGRQLVPQALATGPYSAMQALGPGYWGILSGAVALRSIFSDNAIVYQSPTVSGLLARAMLSSGYDAQAPGGIGEDGAGRQIGVSVAYSAGPMSAAAAAMTTRLGPNPATGATRNFRDMSLAGSYDFGAAKVFAGFYSGEDQSVDDDSRRTLWLGTIVPSGQARIGAQFAQRKDGRNSAPVQAGFVHTGIAARGVAASAKVFSVFGDYALSKRSAVYVSYGRVSNDTNANLALGNGDGPITLRGAAVGTNPSALSVGIRHAF